IAAVLVGLVVVWLVVQPLLRNQRARPEPMEPLDPEETPRGVALAALKEIDFDRETGKLSESDYQFLKAKYTASALQALRAEETGRPDPVEAMIALKTRALTSGGARCRTCGPRPEPDAVYCSTCGLRLSPASAAQTTSANAPAAAALVVPNLSDEGVR
ncbi:MAG TPA: hypothetical protein VE282_06670, partial [Gemmatimonadales bacterium]|nr:hypothetical protein [Gemmatimonadales bacterium]